MDLHWSLPPKEHELLRNKAGVSHLGLAGPGRDEAMALQPRNAALSIG
jgi:hypothetical protein